LWINSLCILCLIYSRTKDLVTLGRNDKIPDMLNFLADVIKSTSSRSQAFTQTFNFVKNIVNNSDPYASTKKSLSIIGLKLAEIVEKYLEEKKWDLREAMRLSAAANIVDTSVLGYEGKDLEVSLFDEPVVEEFVDIPRDNEVYVVLDNAGEALIDIVLAKAFKINGYKVSIVVRKESYEIDVLKYDISEVVDNIDIIETPGNISPIYYIDRGFVVSKGIANMEAYIEVGKIPSIHLLRAKCEVLSKVFNVPKNSPLIVTGETLKNIFSKYSTNLSFS